MTTKRPLSPQLLFDDFALQKALYDEYSGDAHGVPKRGNARSFIVDGRGLGDFAANGQLYSYFCSIHVNLLNNDEMALSLSGNVPDSAQVREWQTRYNVTRNPFLEFTIRRNEQEKLEELAAAMESIVKRGAPRYSVPSYKYVCPQTAYSLRRLKKVLDLTWSIPK